MLLQISIILSIILFIQSFLNPILNLKTQNELHLHSCQNADKCNGEYRTKGCDGLGKIKGYYLLL